MFKNLIKKYSQLPKNTQIIVAFVINGIFVEILKIILLIQLGDPIAAVTYGTLFSYMSAYVIQYKIYKIGNFFSKILVKYAGFTLIAILSIRILVNYLINLPSVQKYLAEEESESNKKTTEYCLMIAPVILFSIIQLFLNPKYIFIVTNKDNQYIFVLYSIAFIIYYLDTQNIFDPLKVEIEETQKTIEKKNNNSNDNSNANANNNVNNNANNNVNNNDISNINDSVNIVKNNSNYKNNNKNIKTRHIKKNNIINSISINTSKVRL